MPTLSLFFIPQPWWWATSVLLSLLLVGTAVAWLARRPHRPLPALLPLFAAFTAAWWLFGFALALWPLHALDTFSQWARASSYLAIPLWMGGVAWCAALLLARLLRTVAR